MTHAQIALTVLGLVLTVGGSALAVTAAVRDWRRFRSAEPLVVPRRLRDWWRHSVRRQPRPRLQWFGSGGDGIGYVDFSAAERTASDDDDLGRRLDALVEIARELEQRAITAHQAATDYSVGASKDTADLRAQISDVATGSVRLELVGVSLAVLGACLSTWSSLLGA